MRLPVVAALGFAGVVLVTSMPVSALLTQRHQLAATSADLARAQAADRLLGEEARELTDPSTVSGLARSDYGLVPPGQEAYAILPDSGSSSTAVADTGHVPLGDSPVVPGSAQSQALLGLGGSYAAGSDPATTPSGSEPARSGSVSSHDASSSSAAGAPGGFWSRVVRTLEFWR